MTKEDFRITSIDFDISKNTLRVQMDWMIRFDLDFGKC